MFAIGVNFFPGSPHSLANVQVAPTPKLYKEPAIGGGGGAAGTIDDVTDTPFLDVTDQPLNEV